MDGGMNIGRAAAGVIAAYGAQAPAQCRIQIEKMKRQSDSTGAKVWEGVLAEVVRLLTPPHLQSGDGPSTGSVVEFTPRPGSKPRPVS